MLFQSIEIVASLLCWSAFAYKWILIISIFLSWMRADLSHPIVRGIQRVTHPFWTWCGRRLPRSIRHWNAYISLLLIIMAQAFIPATLRSISLLAQGTIGSSSLLLQVTGHAFQGSLLVIQNIVSFFMILSLLFFFLGFLQSPYYNPFARMVYTLVGPLLRPLRKVLPKISIDFSPLVLALLCFLLIHQALAPLQNYAHWMSAPVVVCAF